MTHVATLIAAPSKAGLTATIVARAAAALPCVAAPVWLAPDIAADLPFAPPPAAGNAHWQHLIRTVIGDAPLDIVVQPVAGRRKRLLMTDMDSTVIEQECIDELADGVGLKAEVSAITERSMRGEIDFEQSLIERVGLLRGLAVEEATRIVTSRITPMSGARTLVQTMRANGALTVLASGGFTIFTSRVAACLGFDRHYANTLEIEGERLSGTVRPPVFGREAKRVTLRAVRDELGLAPEATIAAGDGANDLAMLEEAALGVAYRAKPAVAAAADAKVEHGDLTALLFMQGYTAAEFAT